ncbi:MAG: Ig-like domain-containing protein, partial [Firmicutes bacterium]|nr:Ig-like domain-containing protein [Bacillota bacterium]
MKKYFTIAFVVLAMVFAAALAGACSTTAAPNPIQSIKITGTPTTPLTAGGDGVQLGYTATPEDCDEFEVAWSSDEPDVASVDQTGLVTPLVKGVARITVQVQGEGYENVRSSISVRVADARDIREIHITDAPDTLMVNQTAQLGYTTLPASNLNDYTVTWSTSSVVYATISQDGFVTAKGAGEVTIKLQVNGEENADVWDAVTIQIEPLTISLTGMSITDKPADNTMAVGGADITLGFEKDPIDATVYDFTWASSNTAVATVSVQGKLHASSAGTTTISVTADGTGISDSFLLTVTDPTKGVLSGIPLDLQGGAEQDGEDIKIVIANSLGTGTNDVFTNTASLTVPDGKDSFTLTAKLTYKPASGNLMAGVLLHQAGYDVIRLARQVGTIIFDDMGAGAMGGGSKSVGDSVTENEIWLRVIKD